MKKVKYKQTDVFDITKIDADILLIPLNGNGAPQKAVLLNEISAAVFEFIGNGKNLLEIIDSLMEKYDVEKSKLEDDINRCIEQLISLKVIDFIEILE